MQWNNNYDKYRDSWFEYHNKFEEGMNDYEWQPSWLLGDGLENIGLIDGFIWFLCFLGPILFAICYFLVK